MMQKSLIPMSERERIVEAVTAMFVNTDRRDWTAVRSCFTDSVWFDMSSLTGIQAADTPADVIVSGWTTGLGSLKAIHHQLGNFQVTITRDGADVTCYGTAYHYLPNKTGHDTRVFVGSYEIHLVSVRGEWKIDMLVYLSKFIDGNRDLEKS